MYTTHKTFAEKTAALMIAIALIAPPYSIFAEESEAASTTPTTASSSSTSTSSESATTQSSTEKAGSATTKEGESTTVSSSSDTSSATTTDTLSIRATSREPTPGTTSESVSDTATSSGSGFVNATSTAESPGNASTTPESASTTPTMSTSSVPVASTTQTVLTGSATAFANILNILNATFLNSTGAILFANFTDAVGDVDLRAGTLFGACTSDGCKGLQGVSLNQLQDAYIRNNILVSAQTGDNTIQDASSSAGIGTGAAYAGLNLVNLANVAFIDANYLLVTMNAFRGVNGDIVLPGLGDFFAGLVTALGGGSSTSNDGTVDNQVNASAQSGNNTVENAPESFIKAGNADSHVNIFNQMNSTVSGNGLWLLLRVSGNWNGDIIGLPEGLTVQRTAQGAAIVGNGKGPLGGVLILHGTTTAGIANNVSVEAGTGDNSIKNASSTAVISTGNAFAGANIINIANQTVMGRNWLLAILNIFGDFNGSISFGRPDLWVGDKVVAEGAVQNGTILTYTLTLANKGDADAHQVALKETPDRARLTVLDASAPYTTDASGNLVFSVGTLRSGATREITYRARIQDTEPEEAITNNTLATLQGTDNNLSDNTDSVTIRTIVISSPGGGGNNPGNVIVIGGPTTEQSQNALQNQNQELQQVPPQSAVLRVERTSAAMEVEAGAPLVSQRLSITNASPQIAREIVLVDVLTDPAGAVVYEERWDLGSIAAGETVVIGYELQFDAGAPSGTYQIEARMSGGNIRSAVHARGTIALIAEEPVLAQVFPLAEAVLPTPDLVVATTPDRPQPYQLPLIPNAGQPASGGVEPGALTAAAASINLSPLQSFMLFFVGLYALGMLYKSLSSRRRL